MNRSFIALLAIPSLLLFSLYACQSSGEKEVTIPANEMKIAHLSQGDQTGLDTIRALFARRNPGYALAYSHETAELSDIAAPSIVFIQQGGGTATINAVDSSKFSVGDIIILKKGDRMTTDSLFSALVFTVPDDTPANIPAFVRPDWDMNITDTPGGCATETNAYRRILLTWLDKVGPYNYHALDHV